MGRPLNKKFFGNRNTGSASTTADDHIGGEGVGSIAVSGTFAGRTTATPYAVTISAPDLPLGVQATATITFATGSTGTVTVTEQGSGYTSVPTATCALGGGTGTVTLTAALTVDTGPVGSATNQENTILMTARLTGGSATTVDIIRQISTNRYKVTDGTRTGIIALKSSVATAAGEGSVRLVDTDGGTYFATKITSRKVVITRGTGVQDAFATGTAVKWNMTAATADSLLIDNA
jgi:hypothetical protein